MSYNITTTIGSNGGSSLLLLSLSFLSLLLTAGLESMHLPYLLHVIVELLLGNL